MKAWDKYPQSTREENKTQVQKGGEFGWSEKSPQDSMGHRKIKAFGRYSDARALRKRCPNLDFRPPNLSRTLRLEPLPNQILRGSIFFGSK